jgi:hypothetical protein
MITYYRNDDVLVTKVLVTDGESIRLLGYSEVTQILSSMETAPLPHSLVLVQRIWLFHNHFLCM